MGNLGYSCGGVSLEEHINNQSKYKFISIGSFGENDEYFDQGLRIVLNERTRKYLLNKNDLVMILNDKTQTCNILGRVLKIDKDYEYIHNQRTQRITPNNKLFSSGYFYFYINSNKFRNKIKQISQGNTQVYINWSIANKCVLKYPSLLDEQNKIAVIFSNIKTIITLHQRKLNALENIKKTLLEKMFADEKSAFPSIRFKEFTNAWEQERLGNLGYSCGGVSLEEHINNQSKYKFISIGSFGENDEYFDQGLRIVLNERTRKYLLNKNDLVMILNDKTQTCNILGRVLKIDKDYEYIHNQRTQRITPNNKLFSSGYFYFYINSNKFRNKIKQISQGNTQVYINWSIANKCVLKYPSLLDEQNKIAVIFSNIKTIITLHQRGHNWGRDEKKIRNFIL
ncbi:restriction endonuclease subunit S [Mycoplasma sp. 332]|uniref:restriction endonuclease subunit S n=1 Tax=Mycoplasma sp. 332 TaxID=3458236 RepID=UPI004036FC72